MIAPLAKFLDWSAIQVMTLMMPAKEYDWRLEEALRFLKVRNFVSTDSQPAQVEFNGPLHFRFPTPSQANFRKTMSFMDGYAGLLPALARATAEPARRSNGSSTPSAIWRLPHGLSEWRASASESPQLVDVLRQPHTVQGHFLRGERKFSLVSALSFAFHTSAPSFAPDGLREKRL